MSVPLPLCSRGSRYEFSLPRVLRNVCALLITACAAHADVFTNVQEAAEYKVAYELVIPVNGGFQGTTPVPYTVDNSLTVATEGFDRVAYYMELTNASGSTWAYASMDAFTTTIPKTGLPHNTTNPGSFQQSVSNLSVFSNVAGVATGSFDRGQIEMWHQNYTATNPTAVFAASATTYDWGDTVGTTASGYGAFQVHNPGAKQVVLAYNRWASGAATNDDVGIGNSSGAHPDWTFSANAGGYTSRKLVVLVRPKKFAVDFTALPMNQQVTPRSLETNSAAIPIAGSETRGGFEKVVLKVYRNGVAYGTDTERELAYVGGAASFAFTTSIPAELASYTFEVFLKQGADLYLVRRVSDVTAGDVLLWYGQSNAEAAVRNGSANAYASPWIRTFGMSSDSGPVTEAYRFWVEANGDGSRGVPAGVGQWALVVGRQIVNNYGIPVAILNGARGGYSMPQLQRDDANPDDLVDSGGVFRTYNRLRHRAIQGKVASAVRAIFFFQGESDSNNTAQHTNGFASLMADWQVDYPSLERVFVTQIHVGCGTNTSRELPALRDAQRRLQDVYGKVRVIASNGLVTHTDNCHFPFAGGYETHGLNSFRQVARELYGAPDAPNIDSPDPLRVEWANLAGDRLRIVLRKPNAGLTIEPGALTHFRLNGSPALLLSATTTNTGIELQYDRSVGTATSLDYLGHIGGLGEWVRNANGVGLLTFSEPIVSQQPFITLVSPAGTTQIPAGSAFPLSATASTPAGSVTRIEVFIDGILHTAVNSANAITANWTNPTDGRHKITFRATNSGGFLSEQSAIVFVGGSSSPGGITSGLNVWLKPETGIVRDASGLVSQWQDSSGNGFHCGQASAAAMPLFVENRFGSMPGVAFDGNDWLGANSGMSTGSYTKIVRVLLSDFTLTGNILSSGATSGARHALYMATSPQPRLWHSSPFVTSSVSMAAGQSYLLVGTYDSATKAGKLYLDGVEVGTGTATANSSDPTYQLGAIAGMNFMRGAIGEALVYNRVLSNTERASVEAYLTDKSQPPPEAPRLTFAAWSGANIPPGADASPNGDANGNGIKNAVEYALGLDPSASGTPEVLDVQTSSGKVDVHYMRPTDRTGVRYELLESFDLQQWTPVADFAGPASAGIEKRRYTRTLGLEQKAFYQLRITVLP